jgi:hypothetical protein
MAAALARKELAAIKTEARVKLSSACFFLGSGIEVFAYLAARESAQTLPFTNNDAFLAAWPDPAIAGEGAP